MKYARQWCQFIVDFFLLGEVQTPENTDLAIETVAIGTYFRADFSWWSEQSHRLVDAV